MESILFLSKADVSTTSGQEMTYHLAVVRKAVNRSFFMTLDSKQIQTLYNFLWKILDNIFKNGQPHVRIAASTTLGEILMTLGPYYHVNLMKSLQNSISLSTDESILILSSFCYLSKFFTKSEISTILSETPIFHLFGVNESDHLVALVDGLLHLPVDFLLTLAEYLYMLAQKYPNNRHFSKAAAKLFEIEPTRFSDILQPSSTHLSLLSGMYPNKIPQIPDDKREILIERCLENLRNNAKPPEIDYSCSLLIALYNTGQVTEERINESINDNLLKNTFSLNSVLSLPIRPEKVQCLYTFDPKATTKVGKFMCDYAKIPTLISFFSKCLENYYKDPSKNTEGISIFQEELLFLMDSSLDPEKETYSNAIDAIPSLENIENKNIFYQILSKAIDSVPTTNWIQQFWLLQMLRRLDYSNIPIDVLQKVFTAIERASISKSEKLQQEAKETTVEISKTLQPIYYRLFVDILIRKLDLFDLLTFEQKFSFIAYLFDNIPESYQISFLNLAYFLHECISTFEFNPECLTYSFKTVSPLVSHLKNDELVLFFIKHAANVIDASFTEFTGETIFPQLTEIFSIANPHRDVIKLNDIDLLQNPNAWHSEIMFCALSALQFLGRVPWLEVEHFFSHGNNEDDISYLFAVARSMLNFFPVEADLCAQSLLVMKNINHKLIIDYVQCALAVLNGFPSLISLASFIANAIEKKQISFKQLSLTKFTKELISNLDSMEIEAIEQAINYPRLFEGLLKFVELSEIETDSKIKERIIEKIQKIIEKYKQQKIEEEQKDYSLQNQANTNQQIDVEEQNLSNEQDDSQELEKMTSIENFASSHFIIENKNLADDPNHLRDFISSITPFTLNDPPSPIPPELESTTMYFLFLLNSGFPHKKQILQNILNYAVQHQSKRLLEQVLKTCSINNIKIDVDKYIDNPFFKNWRVFPIVLGLLSYSSNILTEKRKQYIQECIGERDLTQLIFNSTAFDKKVSFALVKFDPNSFINSFSKINKIKSKHIKVLCYFIRKINFQPDDLFSLVFRIVSSCRKGRKKRLFSLRLFSVFLSKYGPLTPPSISAAEEIIKNMLDENETNPAILNELCYLISVLEPLSPSVKQYSPRLLPLIPPYFPSGSLLQYTTLTPYSLEMIEASLHSEFDSIRILPYTFLTKISKESQPNDSIANVPNEFTKALFEIRDIKSSLCLNSILVLIYSLLRPKLPRERFQAMFDFIIKCVPMNPTSAYSSMINKIFKKMSMLLKMGSRKLDIIFHYAESLFSFSRIDPLSVELLIQSAMKKGVRSEAEQTLDDFLKLYGEAISLPVSTAITLSNYRSNPANKDAFKFLPEFQRFSQMFVSIAILEKVDKTINHLSYESQDLTPMEKKAFELLNDAKTKKYAVLIAFNPNEDFPIDKLKETIK